MMMEKMDMSEDSTRNEQDTVINKYELTLGRIGGEVVVGSITKEQYDYWVNKNDDEIYQHLLEDDIEESEVPSDAWIGNRWFEMDNVEHLMPKINSNDRVFLEYGDINDLSSLLHVFNKILLK